MKRISLKAFAAIALVGVMGMSGYVLANAGGNADTPACCQSKEACCPSQACCKGGSHRTECPMHMNRHA
jgi:hypothetical protein